MMRIEKDTLGEKEVPDDVYYGIQTMRALENFQVSGRTEKPEFIKAYVHLKRACAEANKELGVLEEYKGEKLIQACDRILEGGFEDQFVVDVFQAGAGTSFNMNVNEVIANLALEIIGEEKGNYDVIHPNDHVNMSQSTNDTFPTATHLAVIKMSEKLEDNLQELIEAFREKGKEFLGVYKSGRTHLMDATPITLGDEFLGYSSAVKRGVERLIKVREKLLELPIGGTATGSGMNTPNGFREKVIDTLTDSLGYEFKTPRDSFEAINSRYLLSEYSSSLKLLAQELIRIANDIRLLSSGPSTGLAEIKLPEVQPGSSIMPGKINPVMAECLNMVCFQIIGNDQAVSTASLAGQLEMNVMVPVITYNVLESISLLSNFIPKFTDLCIKGIEADEERCLKYYKESPSLVTVLSPKIGYEKAAELAKESLEKDIPIPELVVEKGIMSEEEAEDLFDPENIASNKYRD